MKTIAFWLGYSNGFNGTNYDLKKIGGTELSIIKIAKLLSNHFKVFIFSNIKENEIQKVNNIQYDKLLNINKYNCIWDNIIISRYLNYFIYVKHKSKNTILWVHDAVPNYLYNGTVLLNYGYPFLHNIQHKIDSIVCVSNWQKNNILNVYSFLDKNKLYIIENLPDNKILNIKINKNQKIKNSFIYFTDLNRGFDLLVDCLLYLEQFYDNLSLTFFKSEQLNENRINKLKLFKTTKIKYYGFVSQDIIYDQLKKTEYFFYPLIGNETFCYCVLEAILFKNVCIFNNNGALNEIINDNGLKINYNSKDLNYVKNTCSKIINLMNDDLLKKKYISNALKFVKKKINIEKIKNKWNNILN